MRLVFDTGMSRALTLSHQDNYVKRMVWGAQPETVKDYAILWHGGDGKWKELRGWVALDDSALENQFHGSVIFRVWVDGEMVWESPVVRGGDTPLGIPALKLGDAGELVLEVDAGTEAFVSDRANWLRPISG